MKTLYKLIYWFIIFQMVILLINFLNVFPPEYTFYSDLEMDALRENVTDGDILGIISWMFVPPTEYLPANLASYEFTIPLIVLMFVGVGTAFAWVTQSFVPVVVIIIGVSFYSMFIKSISFFKTILQGADNQALWALGMILMIGVILALIFTLVETPTHGES